jgi:hypothetical protein
MLICMKPSDKQLETLKVQLALAKKESGLSNAEIGRFSNVHPSQVGRICDGHFRTFSHNVVQICKALNVAVPRLEPEAASANQDWLQAQSSMRKLWDETPERAKVIIRILDAIAELQVPRKG